MLNVFSSNLPCGFQNEKDLRQKSMVMTHEKSNNRNLMFST